VRHAESRRIELSCLASIHVIGPSGEKIGVMRPADYTSVALRGSPANHAPPHVQLSTPGLVSEQSQCGSGQGPFVGSQDAQPIAAAAQAQVGAACPLHESGTAKQSYAGAASGQPAESPQPMVNASHSSPATQRRSPQGTPPSDGSVCETAEESASLAASAGPLPEPPPPTPVVTPLGATDPEEIPDALPLGMPLDAPELDAAPLDEPALVPVELVPLSLAPGADPFPHPPQARTATRTTVEITSVERAIACDLP
jgi:hypothetical protein